VLIFHRTNPWNSHLRATYKAFYSYPNQLLHQTTIATPMRPPTPPSPSLLRAPARPRVLWSYQHAIEAAPSSVAPYGTSPCPTTRLHPPLRLSRPPLRNAGAAHDTANYPPNRPRPRHPPMSPVQKQKQKTTSTPRTPETTPRASATSTDGDVDIGRGVGVGLGLGDDAHIVLDGDTEGGMGLGMGLGMGGGLGITGMGVEGKAMNPSVAAIGAAGGDVGCWQVSCLSLCELVLTSAMPSLQLLASHHPPLSTSSASSNPHDHAEYGFQAHGSRRRRRSPAVATSAVRPRHR
jgi:hypothetical protein